MTILRFSRALAAVVAAVQMTGACHQYRPATLRELHTGDDVRVLLTPGQAQELSETVVVADRRVEGTVIEPLADGVLLEAPSASFAEGIRIRSYRQRLRLPASAVVDAERRELDRRRTFALAGAVGAVVAAILWSQLGDSRLGDQVGLPPIQEFRSWGVHVPLSPP